MAVESGIGSTGGRELRSWEAGKRLSRVLVRESRSSEADLKSVSSVRGG
jgi:hypothetical protein